MTPTIIIPARFASTRFPGKPLHHIAGRPLIEWTWRAAMETGWPVYIATDSKEILAVASEFGAAVVVTGECHNGTERVAEAAAKLGLTSEVYINWQGDSPLLPADWVRALVDEVSPLRVVTPVQACDKDMMRRLRADRAAGSLNVAMAVLDEEYNALYFSRELVPHRGPWFLHIGVYAIHRTALALYGRNPGWLEESESLEQLRWLEEGMQILAVPVPIRPFWEVNVPADVHMVERLLNDV